MADSLRYKDWLEKASRGIKSAKLLFDHNCGNDIVTFHCQQALEKSLKGYLLKHKNIVIEGHSLIYLCKESSNISSEFTIHLKNCAFVNQYYIETRYPADMPTIISDEDTDDCINIAGEIYDLVKSNLL